ncbi:hypothetical protein PS938_05658 [Pseudomonas fluorescens]|uniref:Uncharacterized protein n=1 Tax=Pseudomonas fluorescens TaxID=294 RepID=A0A5E7VQH4_PSEFL|nr:hypothetical protein PS938_05658 [Pseudomonas fluorescens]
MPHPLADDRQAQQKVETLWRNFAVHAHLEPGPDARHAEHDGRPCTLQIGQEGVEAFGKEYRLPAIDRRQFDEHSFGDVAQRQVGQQPVRLVETE